MQSAIPVYDAVAATDGHAPRLEGTPRALATGEPKAAIPAAGPRADAEPARFRPGKPHTGSLLAWGLMGFILGAVFWHFVGFWHFVRTIVLPLPKPVERVMVDTPLPPTGCAAFVLDRESGAVLPTPCRIVDLADRPAGPKAARLQPWQTQTVAGP